MRRAAAAVLATAAIVSACGGTEPGNPVPATSKTATSAPTGGSLPGYGAPKVEESLDISHFLATPCDVLTNAEITDFLGSKAETRPDVDGAGGPGCSWGTGQQHARIFVFFPRLDNQGLTSLYKNQDNGELFEKMTPAEGYPVVAYGVNDNRDEGECTVRVGTSDTETVDINLYLSDDKVGELDPCEAAHEVAVAVIGNIKARN